MKFLNQEIESKLRNQGTGLIRFVNISNLSEKQNRHFPHAIIFSLPINAEYINDVYGTPNYVHFDDDQYAQTENRAGELADELARCLAEKGYKAVSQSDAGLLADEVFNFEAKESVLPHKTVALLSGSGWIGKNNLLITPEYGAAQCLGTVLTDAPLETVLCKPLLSKCGNCNVCKEICEKKVIKGKTWTAVVTRDEIVDVYGCSTCLKCLVHCPWTMKYVKKSLQTT